MILSQGNRRLFVGTEPATPEARDKSYKSLGYRGRGWRITLPSGETIITHNLWESNPSTHPNAEGEIASMRDLSDAETRAYFAALEARDLVAA